MMFSSSVLVGEVNGISVMGDMSLTSGTSMKFFSESRSFMSGLWYTETSILGIGKELLLFLGCVCFDISSHMSRSLK